MRKKLFFGVSFIVFMFMTVAWQYATAEIAALQQEKKDSPAKSSELVFSSHSSEIDSTRIL